MIATTVRKLILVAGTAQNVRDLTAPRPFMSKYYYASGGGTVELGKVVSMTSTNGFPVPAGVVFEDRDQSHERFALVTGANVTLFIEDYVG